MPKYGGRKKKPRAENLDETQGEGGFLENYRGKRNYQVSLSERIRQLTDLDLLAKYWFTILEGYNAVWVKNKKGQYYDVIPDPSPLTGSSTPAQRDAAVRELMNRGWGMAVQSIQLDAQFKTQVEPLPLSGVDVALIAEVQQLLLKASKPQLTNIVDAELVGEELQEVSQVSEPSDLLNKDELQEAGQLDGDLQNPYHGSAENLGRALAAVAEIMLSANENSPLED